MAKPKIFVSYSHKEADWAKEFAQALSQRGLRVWIDQLAVKAGDRTCYGWRCRGIDFAA